MTDSSSGADPPSDDDGEKPKKCPTCGVGDDPTPKEPPPPYLDPPRVPKDSETLIGRERLKKAAGGSKRVKGATVYERGNGLVHRDTLHVGKAAELETYNSTGSVHRGTICPHCGTHKGDKSVDKKKKCDP
jgi:ribosomal protein L32